ncbi:DEAD/DEAH box helicase [Empedobacter sp.]|uniref:DEAD/DEAH box helicase n=1 Tax=Empedobacter sp. TaxID=1927715 RepID=UPI0028B1B7DD|nr:DEAD/DEAH box helicase [Empedobacter sp.]
MTNSNETLINQDNREVIIKKLDESNENVELEDLFLFDLSPYYDEKLDDSFFSKQLEFIQEKNQLKHNSKISFTPEQNRIYNGIIENNRSIVSAPTSFGKTMLIKEYIFNYQPNKVVFIVPTNSLADELIDDFDAIFKSLDYSIFDIIKIESDIDAKSIFIGTQEKYYQIHQKYKNHIDLFVIDEAYKLSDKVNSSREVILNRTFIDTLSIANKVILLLPLVNEICGLKDLDFEVLKSEYAPVAKNFQPLIDFENELLKKISENDDSTLIYFNTPNEAEIYFLDKVEKLNNDVYFEDNWINRLESDFHPEWIPIKAIKKGIGIHYGPMPKFIQKKVINLFNASKIKTLLATSSVIEGVNTPTKNIYITTSTSILGDKNLIKFKNLIGRAGRLGIHKVGYVFYKDSDKKEFEKANVPFSDISLNFIIENPLQIIEINREEEYKVTEVKKSLNEILENNYKENTNEYLNELNYGNIPLEEISKLLNNYGFTIKQFKKLITYIEEGNVNLFGILGKLKSSDKDIYSINVVLNNDYLTFNEMVENLKLENKFSSFDISKLVSIVIKMIYNVIPHKVIPAIEFMLELNTLYKVHNGRNLLTKSVINEANTKRNLFYKKFIGEEDTDKNLSKIMTKLFEYGIPYFRIKDHLLEILDKIPNNFSIHDIKKVIFENEKMNDLRVYFE